MANEADDAQKLQDLYLKMALKNRAEVAPKATGYCLNCDEKLDNTLSPTVANRRWCDKECQSDWEYRQ